MLDISQAANLLTSMGVSSTLATRAAERTAQNHSDADPLTFLKELRATLEELSAEAPSGTVGTAAGAASTDNAAYTSTTDLYTKSTAPSSTTSATTTAEKAAATVPFKNLEEFKQWEKDLGATFAADYEPPDYVRMHAMVLSGGDDTVVGRYMFFKNHPEFAADYESIRSGNLSKFPTDGSTLIRSDLSKMSEETAAYYRKNPNALLAAEGFNMDPTLAKMRMNGEINPPTGTDASEWLMSSKWTKDGIVAENNRVAYANADYIGLDGKGAGTYKRSRLDAATGNIINYDGRIYDPLTGEVKA
ncbi:hypothetical protein OIN59_12690 [Acidovorax sp. D2M1]|uniref:Uncharacterized protein n=1 Tax=Acidovorax benzenivorans TaxID=2987520 RepID=A0ABT5RX77_9BURK|nr:hypothetical protein [Acidovorax benzenivorans]MDD2178290.1 hypothetical protein [Acidovorax benzenivorans]